MRESPQILFPCSAPGCRELTTRGGFCPDHQRARGRRHDEQRASSTERGYDADHRRLRIRCFVRDNWRCVDCGWEPDIVRLCREAGLDPPPAFRVLVELRDRFADRLTHLHADHVVPIAERPDLRLDLDNLQTRCDRCHRARTRREQKPLAASG
jgi:5-methylcytosine-specific restriction endonuclease McrA